MPTLIQNHKQKVLYAQFKKAYSVLQQAYQKVYAEEGYNYECYYWDKRPYPEPVCANENDAGTCIDIRLPDGSKPPADYSGRMDAVQCREFMAKLETHLNIVKKCNGNALRDGCIPNYKGNDTLYKERDDEMTDELAVQKNSGCAMWSQDSIDNTRNAYVLADGTIILMYNNNGPSLFAVDINGKKGPNKWGVDLFPFGTRGGIQTPIYVALDISCNAPLEKGSVTTKQMLINSNK